MKPIAPYSPVFRWDHPLFTSGQFGLYPENDKLTAGGVEAESCQALHNLSAILESTDFSLEHVLKITVYIKDMNDYVLLNRIYAEYFVEKPSIPAIVQGALPAGAFLEYDAIAVIRPA